MNNEGTKLRMSGFMESRTVCFTFAVSLSSNNDVVILRVLSLYETLLLLHTLKPNMSSLMLITVTQQSTERLQRDL